MNYAYLCPTPKNCCTGKVGNYSASLDKQGIKKHGSPHEAMACYVRYLTQTLGYERLSSREFRPPDGGPIVVLSKVSRFGARLRSGKSGEGSANSNSRGMPSVRTGGVIICT